MLTLSSSSSSFSDDEESSEEDSSEDLFVAPSNRRRTRSSASAEEARALLSEVLATSSGRSSVDALGACLHAYCADLLIDATRSERARTHAGVRSAMLACASLLLRPAKKKPPADDEVGFVYTLLLHALSVGVPGTSAGGAPRASSVQELLLQHQQRLEPPQLLEQGLVWIESAFGLVRLAATLREMVRLRVIHDAIDNPQVGEVARERCIEPARTMMQELFDADVYEAALDAERAAWRYLLDDLVGAGSPVGGEAALRLRNFVDDCMDADRLQARVFRGSRDDDENLPPLEEMVARLQLVPRVSRRSVDDLSPIDAAILRRIASSPPIGTFASVVEGIRVAFCNMGSGSGSGPPLFASQQLQRGHHPLSVVPALRILGIARDRLAQRGTIVVLVRWKTLVLFSPPANLNELLHPYTPTPTADSEPEGGAHEQKQQQQHVEVEDAWVPFGSTCLSPMRLILVRDFFERSGLGCDASQPGTVGWYALRLVPSAAYGGALAWTMGIVVSVASNRCEVLYEDGGVGWHDHASLLQDEGSFFFFNFTNALRGLHKAQGRRTEPQEGSSISSEAMLVAWLRENGLHSFLARECSSYEESHGARLAAAARALVVEYAGLC